MNVRTLGFRIVAGAAAIALAAALMVGVGLFDGRAIDHGAAPDARPTELAHQATTPDRGPGDTLAGVPQAPGAPVPAGDPTDPSDAAGSADASDASDASDAQTDDGTDDHIRDGRPLTADHPLVAPVIAVQNRWTRSLMEHPLVVGVGTGMTEDGDVAIVVLAKAPIDDLPASVEGVPLEVHVTGELNAFPGNGNGNNGNGGGGGGDAPAVDTTARFDRPVPIGVSTGHPSITAGTIGCRVKKNGNVFALSNNHVYAAQNTAAIGDDVIQPGTYDGGVSPADDIGALDDYEPIDFSGTNTMDAAIALSSTAELGNATPADGYGTPRSTTYAPAINLRVMKYGRTTGETNGRIQAINTTVTVGYGSGTAIFVNQVVISPGSFSAGGDSGSLIVVQKGGDARKPVALLFAGSFTATIGCPIDPILSRFGVTIDGN